MEMKLAGKQAHSEPWEMSVRSEKILDLFNGLQTRAEAGAAELNAACLNARCREPELNEMCFYHIKQLSYDKEYPHREAFENVLLSLDDPEFNFVYILTGTRERIDLCIGIVKNQNAPRPSMENASQVHLNAVNYGEIAARLFEGNFNGSQLEKVTGGQLRELAIQSAQEYNHAGVITGVPSARENDGKEHADFQGIDRLINSMLGLEWRLVIVCEPVGKDEIRRVQEQVYALYNELSMYAKWTMQQGRNSSENRSEGHSESESRGKNFGYSKSDTSSQSRSSGEQSRSTGESTSRQEGTSEGKNYGKTKGNSQSTGHSQGTSSSMTVELANKKAQELMKYMDDELLERLRTGFSRGLFKTSVYYMAKSPAQANRLKSGVLSLFQGSRSSYSPLRAQSIVLNSETNRSIFRSIFNSYQNRYLQTMDDSPDALTLMSIPFSERKEGLQTYLTAGEVSLLAGLPQKEVPGLPMKEGVGFGLNLKAGGGLYAETPEPGGQINLGVMVQQGRKLANSPFYLPRESLMKHTFIAGVTGSGKTTTCHRLLREAETPFLVLEPAKTEYRALLASDPDLMVFTLGNESAAPFRINPFELVEGEVISAHIDMVKAVFTSAFPMEASMPQLLEEAIYLCYEKLGWDIAGCYESRAQEERRFPVMSDLIQAVQEVVKDKGFGNRLQSEYTGSLVSRLSNLTKGVKGLMLDCLTSTDFNYLLEHRVVLEMEELKSPEDKALFMGFILSRLTAVIRRKHQESQEKSRLRHITLVEEAHRLLSKVEPGDSGAKKAAVETFTDLLAEVRKYGEGLIVVDQIPNKLAPEVLKNTNTKIIHKLLARDDQEAVGDTMLMDDKQKKYLAALDVGHAVVFSEQTDKPVHVSINAASNTNGREVPEEDVRSRFEQRKISLGGCYQHSVDRELSRKFDAVAGDLARMNADPLKCQALKECVAAAARQQGRTEEEIWREVILWWDIRTGKSVASSVPSAGRQKALLEFFTGVFGKPDLSKDDLPEDAAFYGYFR